MDWKTCGGAFALIFLAELGDKTQLTALGLVKNPGDRWAVYGGAVAALAASTLIAVLAGGWLARAVPPFWLKTASGALFLAFGALTLREAFAAR
jgi:putative Ca2+/H+ antiporter (TMEM165/GDT1 family)